MPMFTPAVIAGITAAAAGVGAATGIYSATKGGPKAQGQPQVEKNPNANVYKDRNAQNAIVAGGDSTGTGSLLSSPSNVAGNSLLGQ